MNLQEILAAMSEGVLALDTRLCVTLVNRAALRLLAVSTSPLGQTLLETSRIPALSHLARKALAGETSEIEFTLPTERRMISARGAPLDGGCVLVMREVTEMRRLETIRRDFVANVSHELRTPVSVIRANAETLLEGALEEIDVARPFVEAIFRQSEALDFLIRDLLDLAKIEAGAYRLNTSPVQLGAVVQRVLDTLSVKRHDVSVAIDDKLFLEADGKALEHVLLNLIDNAVKYTPSPGSIVVRAHETAGRVCIEIIDDGPGIEAHHRARLFERFYRVDPGRGRGTGGTGLGLAIVKHWVEAMGGQVSVDAVQAHGTVFRVMLTKC